MRLLLARHAPTDWNAIGRFQGHADPPLGPVGRDKARRLGQRLAAEPINRIYSSDLVRAWYTSLAVSEGRSLPLAADTRLRELNVGAWEGLTRHEIEERDCTALTAWDADPLSVAPPGGETVIQLAERVAPFLAGLRGSAPANETVLVVAHSGSLRVLLCLALGLPTAAHWQFRLDPASLSELMLHAAGATLNFLNDTHHLREASDLRRESDEDAR